MSIQTKTQKQIDILEAVKANDADKVTEIMALHGQKLFERYTLPIATAIEMGHAESLEAMLRAGLDPETNLDSASEMPLLFYAAYKKQTKCVELLLKYHAQVNRCNDLYDISGTALMTAAYRGAWDICELLLAHNADPRIKSTKQKTVYEDVSQWDRKKFVAIVAKYRSEMMEKISDGKWMAIQLPQSRKKLRVASVKNNVRV